MIIVAIMPKVVVGLGLELIGLPWLAIGGRPESWIFYTTFRCVFLDLEDYPIEVPPIITFICPSRGRDGSSIFSFNFSSL